MLEFIFIVVIIALVIGLIRWAYRRITYVEPETLIVTEDYEADNYLYNSSYYGGQAGVLPRRFNNNYPTSPTVIVEDVPQIVILPEPIIEIPSIIDSLVMEVNDSFSGFGGGDSGGAGASSDWGSFDTSSSCDSSSSYDSGSGGCDTSSSFDSGSSCDSGSF